MKNKFWQYSRKKSLQEKNFPFVLNNGFRKTKVSWVQVIGENSFLQKFFPVGITFHFMSSIILSNNSER